LGLVPLATGSDSGGSLRIPASYCGLVGFKGTYGRIPRGPLYVGLPNVRNYGALARTVADVTRFLDCVVGCDERDPLSLPHPGFSYEERVRVEPLAGLRATWTEDLGFGACGPDMASLVRDAASALVRDAEDPEEMAQVLTDLIADPARRFEYGRAARRRVHDQRRAGSVQDEHM